MTKKELKDQAKEYADASIKYVAVRVPWMKAHWRELLIVVLVLAALFAFWRWQVHAAEAERLGRLVEVGAKIEESQARLDALDREANERRLQIKAKLEQLADADKRLAEQRKKLAESAAARVANLPKDSAGVAAELTKLGFPAKPVEAK